MIASLPFTAKSNRRKLPLSEPMQSTETCERRRCLATIRNTRELRRFLPI